MQIYLVGGAVRDQLLDYPIKDRDYVVVGATVDDMLQQGFSPVGKDFPVFIHPISKDEYALARTERKSGVGYKGFEVFASPTVTLEQDLQRRDLTINAMALSNGQLIDPYGGKADLDAKVLRHVSDKFTEDPLRVLRVARFAARYAHLGFTIAPETMAMMRQITGNNELQSLVAERVWQEIEGALAEQSPWVFFETLRECGALAVILPEIDNLFGVPQPAQHHPEIDTGIHTLMVLRQAALLSSLTTVRFAALTHDLGKGLTPAEQWPSHHGHEVKGLTLLKQLAVRLRTPNDFLELAQKVMQFHTHCHRALELKPATLLKMLDSIGAFRQAEKVELFLLACEADSKGRLGLEHGEYPQADRVRRAFLAVKGVTADEFVEQGLTGKKIGDAVFNKRVDIIAKLNKND
ncbi:MAG: multifunctional CCA addition/repair protein [Cycloclasticus sp.]|nr:multifunctional CCA addition/repair protein [Cycloclasticus sp.]MBQ0790421.1 multifunctional CCA addition/repair protein [Cycloclasticus sp.]